MSKRYFRSKFCSYMVMSFPFYVDWRRLLQHCFVTIVASIKKRIYSAAGVSHGTPSLWDVLGKPLLDKSMVM